MLSKQLNKQFSWGSTPQENYQGAIMELDKLLKKRSIISCTIKDGICIVQYASKEMKLLDISGMGIVEVLDFILEE